MIGIGDNPYNLVVFIDKRPNIDRYKNLNILEPAVEGELGEIGLITGNHWRKIINIYAKLGYGLNTEGYSSWQNYRDLFLLTKHSKQALRFDAHSSTTQESCVNIICGKAYAGTMLKNCSLSCVDEDFSIDRSKRIIVTPYFDYRQISNLKLQKLVELVRDM